MDSRNKHSLFIEIRLFSPGSTILKVHFKEYNQICLFNEDVIYRCIDSMWLHVSCNVRCIFTRRTPFLLQLNKQTTSTQTTDH